jgi:hypothetical protein
MRRPADWAGVTSIPTVWRDRLGRIAQAQHGQIVDLAKILSHMRVRTEPATGQPLQQI